MAGSALGTIKTALAPLLVAGALYLLLSFILLPLYRRHRANIQRYAQYAPLTSTIQSTTSIFGEHIPEALRPRSIQEKLSDFFLKFLLPSLWSIRNRRGSQGQGLDRRDSSTSDDDGGLFDAESGERMVGFDMDPARRGVDGQRRNDGRLGIRDSGENDAIQVHAAMARSNYNDEPSTRRLSRELEEGFRDDSASEDSDHEVTVGRRRLSMAASR